jgi:ABC-2 type transport system ATP-binding protein
LTITLKALTKTFPGGVTALNKISLSIPNGMYGLLGPNGAGKTTLMRILCTILPPTSGQIDICGLDPVKQPQAVRQIIGYLPQEFGVYKRLTAYEYLDFAAGMKGLSRPESKRQVEELLDKVNLTQERKKAVGSFSGGMKRRLGIAQALLGAPQVLVVDEPTAGLDPEERLRFRNLLTEISGERVVLLSTHIVSDIESACSNLAVIGRGQVRFTGLPEELALRAEGQVWNLEVSSAEYERLRGQLKIISSRRTGGGMALRVLAAANPFGLGEPGAPTMEDGYLTLMDEVVV